MGKGGAKFDRTDIIDNYNPSLVGRAAQKGTIFRYIPAIGSPQLFIKEDDGFSTNWTALGEGTSGPLTTVNAASPINVDVANPPANIDGGAGGTVGDLWLLPNQTAPEENGVYTFNGAGIPLTRAPGWDEAAEFQPGREVYVDSGATLAETMWVNEDEVAVLGVDPVTFSEVNTTVFMRRNFSNAQNAANAINMGGFQINNMADPTLAQDAATKAYVDGAIVPVSGDPNTMAFFNGLGNLSDDLNFSLDPAAFAAQSLIQIGTADPFARKQIWDTLTDSVIRQGAWQSDGDAFSKSSEGIVVYGNSVTGTPISATDGGYARVKHNRFGLFTIDQATSLTAGNYYWRVDDSEMFYQTNTNVRSFSLMRDNGRLFFGLTATGGTLVSSNSGSLAHGNAVTAGSLTASGLGSYAGGRAATSGTITSSNNGSLAHGNATSSGAVLASGIGSVAHGASSGAASSITSSGDGSLAHGSISNAGGTIVASGSGSIASGLSITGGDIVASGTASKAFGVSTGAAGLITAVGDASFAFGSVTGATINATDTGALAHGNATDAGSAVTASGVGSMASGSVSTAGTVIASAIGAVASGRAVAGNISATAIGAVAHGDVNAGGGAAITADGAGSLAHGALAALATGTFIDVNGIGSQAHGSCTGINSGLGTNGDGSYVHGLTSGANSSMIADGAGSQIFGVTSGDSGSISALANGSLAYGHSVTGSSMSSSGDGSSAHGKADTTATITATGAGSNAYGSAEDATSAILSSGLGSDACGGVFAAGLITASGSGARAGGEGDTSGLILADGVGALAHGFAIDANSKIQANSEGSMSSGTAETGGNIQSSVSGAWAHGTASGALTQIASGGLGSLAQGQAVTGGQINATGNGSIAAGVATTNNIAASGSGSIAMGTSAGGALTTSGAGSIVMGSDSVNTADFSQTFGQGHSNSSFACLVIGRFAPSTAYTAGSWVATDPVFVIGHGANSGARDYAFRIMKNADIQLYRTNTAGGTTGAQIINKPAGSVNFAGGATTLVVTNSLVDANSIVICTVLTNDATALIKNVVAGAGSFTITLNAAATGETRVGFLVLN